MDWVGLSLYAHMYFQGDKTHERETEIVFKTGLNSNPVIAVKDIVEKYGNRKPIMISESGCGHKLLSSGENLTEFALQRLREYYAYLPMVYPQIKLIAYFDYMVNSPYEKYDLRLTANPQLQSEYLKLVKGPRYVQDSYSNTVGYCNRPVYNGINLDSVFEVSCYAHLYGSTVESVTYFIDDEFRWYLIETVGGTYTQYRYRPVYTEYVYEEWNGWSDWSNWDDDDPYDYLDMYDDEWIMM